jgi:predicted DNA-binding protein (MmcQ/YjbR family)
LPPAGGVHILFLYGWQCGIIGSTNKSLYLLTIIAEWQRADRKVFAMNRAGFMQFILEQYSVEPDYPWMKNPNFAVFRHSNNQKWFALIMDIPRSRLGLPGDELLDVVNLKCDPLLIGSLRSEPGFFPAYHMNKDSWITVSLDNKADADKLKMLLDMSYTATASKIRKKH